MKKQNFFIQAPFEFKASPDSSTNAVLAGVAYNGGGINRWGETLVIDIASVRCEQEMPILLQHNVDQYVGVTTGIDLTGNNISLEGCLFTSADEAASKVKSKADAGAKYQLSVGIYDYNIESVAAGKESMVNGAIFHGPCSVLRDAFLREVSIVVLGADSSTKVSIFQTDPEQEMNELELQVQKNAELEKELLLAREAVALAEASAKAAEQLARKTKASVLLQELGLEEADLDKYAALDAETFDFVAGQLRSLNKKMPEELFKHQADNGATTDKKVAKLSMVDIYSKRA